MSRYNYAYMLFLWRDTLRRVDVAKFMSGRDGAVLDTSTDPQWV